MDIAVVSASKNAQKASEAPSTIYVINEEQIEIRGYTNLEELLEDIPEIEIQRKSVTEFSNFITFRGIPGNEKFMILQDGVRIASMTGTPHAITHNYSIAHAKRIEIILGPASALYGADAFTGIINIITQDGSSYNGAKLNSSFGSFKTTDNQFVAGAGDDNTSILVTGKFYTSDEPEFPEYYPEEYEWYTNNYKTNGEVLSSPFDPSVVQMTEIEEYRTPTSAYFYSAKANLSNVQLGFTRNFESHNTSVGGRPEFNIYAKDARYDVVNQITYLNHNFESSNKKWGITSTASYSIFELTPDSKFINTFTAYGEGYKYASSQKFKLDEQFTYAFNERNQLMAGFTMEDITALPKTGDLPFAFDKDKPVDLQKIYYMGTNVFDSAGNDMSIYQDFYNLHYENYGGYLQLQSKLVEQVSLTFGGRFDYNTRYGSTVNPRLGIILKPIDKLSAKILLGQAYLAPSPYVTYQHYGAFVPIFDSLGNFATIIGPYWHLPNPDLKPEEITTMRPVLTII